ncbi:trimethylamine---corrinoid protein Co-methyltransferase [Desulforhopalus singaporensis]|uniref:Trimethylamine---corrinoid protein Co-methyltransferase n=1 Tax=Desulforhopalus singaporensis TaxID=91360 RepID=A0A1H0LID6_9BACT|nr:trimethylamine---corrinoid protein Co-methyltransferase [Desulforhopalus singaporensis]
MIESGMTFDFAQLVMDNEFAKMIRQVVKGIKVNDDTLAVDATREVGQFKDFLTHPSTFKHMKEQSQPAIIDRKGRDKWESSGSLSLYDRALNKARDILANHKPLPLPDEVREKIRMIVKNAEKEKGVQPYE